MAMAAHRVNGVHTQNNVQVKDTSVTSDTTDYSENSFDKTPQEETTEAQPPPQGGYLWRFSSGVYNVTTGAVSTAASASVSGVKWVAGAGANAGSAIYSKVPTIKLKRKDKNE